jgi:hypothetical protein
VFGKLNAANTWQSPEVIPTNMAASNFAAALSTREKEWASLDRLTPTFLDRKGISMEDAVSRPVAARDDYNNYGRKRNLRPTCGPVNPSPVVSA